VKFKPASSVSPYAVVGGGYADYEQSTTRIEGQSNSASRELARGAFDFGAGVDVRVWRFVALRGEARDLYTGSPGYNVAAISGGPVGFVAMRDAALTFTVDFAKSRRKCEGSFAATLLMIAEKHGINVPNSCRVGKCGTCASAC
jgi:hypothetical protein